jgi:hypothetical protein
LSTDASFSKNERAYWIDAFVRECGDALDELRYLAPWIWSSFDRRELSVLDEIPTLRESSDDETRLSALREYRKPAGADASQNANLEELRRQIEKGSSHARERLDIIEGLLSKCDDFSQMEYGFLYDEARRLLSIGYNVTELRLDASFYDLLASEARQAVFVGIARGLLPQESWFALGRRLAVSGGEQILLSWSGSMFEYLMPLLVMPAYEHTLLDETCRAAVSRQIAYGKKLALPWGISECGYNSLDVRQDYQ